MLDVRKIQEQVIFEAVKSKSNEETAREIVFGENRDNEEENPLWVKSAMARLEAKFDPDKVKQIRMSCQCGYGMDEKLTLVKDLMAGATSMDEFANSARAQEAGLFSEDGILYLQFPFCPCPMRC